MLQEKTIKNARTRAGKPSSLARARRDVASRARPSRSMTKQTMIPSPRVARPRSFEERFLRRLYLLIWACGVAKSGGGDEHAKTRRRLRMNGAHLPGGVLSLAPALLPIDFGHYQILDETEVIANHSRGNDVRIVVPDGIRRRVACRCVVFGHILHTGEVTERVTGIRCARVLLRGRVNEHVLRL